MRQFCKLLSGVLLLAATSVHATTIEYTLDNLGGGSWQYNYSVSNNSLAGAINEFTIYFDGKYANLNVVTSPTGWDDLLAQPGSFIGLNDGFYDSYSAAGIGAGGSASVFSVSFDWRVAGTPGDQVFEIVDPISFAVLDSGVTTQAVVPLPGALVLFVYGIGLLSGFGLIRRRV